MTSSGAPFTAVYDEAASRYAQFCYAVSREGGREDGVNLPNMMGEMGD